MRLGVELTVGQIVADNLRKDLSLGIRTRLAPLHVSLYLGELAGCPDSTPDCG